ncbi:hypothetical protein LR48_Vigan53s001300 [Vigna angularis]|uniref:Putative plant transposon protein domain-containing protein n=1 Tax=Phaseolus angularis TaxID=3914 RepID=A0A0L9T3N7_PHAAN|nr:hypothetical protein LR48_Vigan53s001300 [Vigna angularis]
MDEDINYTKVEQTLCMQGARFQRNRNDTPIHIKRTYLAPLAKYWMTFTHSNIQPCSHVSDITTNRAIILFYVLRGLNINLGQVIANEIKHCAHSVNNKAHLGHPSLITHFCELAWVNVSHPPFERPRKEIDASYYTQYCMLDEAGIPMPTPQPPRVHRRVLQPDQQGQAQDDAQDAAPFQMRDMYMSLMESRMDALYRGKQAIMMNLTSAFPERKFMTQEEFQAYVAWPADPTQDGGGAGASGATTMEEHEEEEKEEEDEEEDDEDEEEDSDDSWG